MILGTVGSAVNEDFSVVAPNLSLVSGLTTVDFSFHLFNTTGVEVSSTVPVSVVEMGNGHYRASFTPNEKGTWYLVVYHTNYFPQGKGANVQVYNRDLDDVSALTADQQKWLLETWRIHGLDVDRPLVSTTTSQTAGPEIQQTVDDDFTNNKTTITRDV